MNKVRIGIIGSRDYGNMAQVREYIQNKLAPHFIVVSGGARGVDTVAVEQAEAQGLETHVMKADWRRFGKSAGMIRNAEMLKTVDIVVAFWDGKSPGTKHSIDYALEHGITLIVIQHRAEANHA